ncbi:hypothetical protein ONS95_004756 [Cadophora gregata]|uniref:uncharacterized protein n=1 Tax=Cadophora gregata TaxID=51156 RepID=UPI0026DD66D8|nr:uncharacterized protein ONS95_004756 [Cadophora gregata]KAK0104467.1 hypothetical protein ONS95_004756 [Cadophora gregata]
MIAYLPFRLSDLLMGCWTIPVSSLQSSIVLSYPFPWPAMPLSGPRSSIDLPFPSFRSPVLSKLHARTLLDSFQMLDSGSKSPSLDPYDEGPPASHQSRSSLSMFLLHVITPLTRALDRNNMRCDGDKGGCEGH